MINVKCTFLLMVLFIGNGTSTKIFNCLGRNFKTIWNWKIETFIGKPLKFLTQIGNQIGSIVIEKYKSTFHILPNVNQINKMNLILFKNNKKYKVPLEKSEYLWSHRLFRKHMKVTILITGWMTNANKTNRAIGVISAAYKKRGNHNFIVLDSARNIDTFYSWSAFNTNKVGVKVGQALIKLLDVVPAKNVHVIGYSLGAHIAGIAGRTLKKIKGIKLKRITGLDPANPCFHQDEILSGLKRGDAQFIDVIHTNPGVLGKIESLGDVDFYPNGFKILQPGCSTLFCSHGRSYEFYAETVYRGQELNFPSVKCNSIKSFKSGKCNGIKMAMGYAVPLNVKGNFFLKTKSKSPFGKKKIK